MAFETLFLGVLVLALFLGHFFLELTKPKEKVFEASAETQKLLMPSQTISLSSEHQILSSIIERLDKMEKLLLSTKTVSGELVKGQRIENGFQKKIQSLIDFKHEIRIEVAALKDDVKKIREFIGMKEEQRQETEIPEDRLRELVFNVRK